MFHREAELMQMFVIIIGSGIEGTALLAPHRRTRDMTRRKEGSAIRDRK
jgi:hypothetical protein